VKARSSVCAMTSVFSGRVTTRMSRHLRTIRSIESHDRPSCIGRVSWIRSGLQAVRVSGRRDHPTRWSLWCSRNTLGRRAWRGGGGSSACVGSCLTASAPWKPRQQRGRRGSVRQRLRVPTRQTPEMRTRLAPEQQQHGRNTCASPVTVRCLAQGQASLDSSGPPCRAAMARDGEPHSLRSAPGRPSFCGPALGSAGPPYLLTRLRPVDSGAGRPSRTALASWTRRWDSCRGRPVPPRVGAGVPPRIGPPLPAGCRSCQPHRDPRGPPGALAPGSEGDSMPPRIEQARSNVR
jgi:hypothetical protein